MCTLVKSMEEIDCNCVKITIKDLKSAIQNNNEWNLNIKNSINNRNVTKTVKFSRVWLQGTIEQNTLGDIFLISDNSEKAKITNCKSALVYEIDCSKGVYCNIIGSLVRIKGIPEVEAHIITSLGKGDEINLFKKFWQLEVQEFQLFLLNVFSPDLNQ